MPLLEPKRFVMDIETTNPVSGRNDTGISEKKGKELFKKTCEFVAGAAKIEAVPINKIPEIAFVGRSNVGKSSLLNSLTQRKSLARTSKTPGCTRQLNFFQIEDKITLVDLPGYGYARASRKEVEGWNELIKDYLRGRPNLKQVCLLIDSRHGVKKNDEEIMSLLDELAVSYQIILTKTDKQSKKGIEEIKNKIENMAEKHAALHPEVVETSSVSHDGLNYLRGIIARFATP